MAVLEKIEHFLKDLLSSLQSARLYATEHPLFKKSVEKAYLSLQEILREREELVIGIVGTELAFEKEILFDLSKAVMPAIVYLKERGIERIVFYQGIKEDELTKFIAFLVIPKTEIKKEAQDYLTLAGIKNISVGKIKVSSPSLSEESQQLISHLSVYDSSLEQIVQSLANVLDAQALNHLDLKFTINNITENLSSHYREFLRLVTLKRYDVGTSEHILNVSILAMYFSSKIGFASDDVLDIGIAALFHDIGKQYISRKILTKAEQLKDEEFNRIKSHTVLGAELLLKYVDTLGILPVVVCFEHHLKYDLSGYPKLSFSRKPHIASLIVSVCDVYDALSQRRGYKADYTPDLIYNIMIKQRGSLFEPGLLDKFFKVMGVWPIGSIVSLSDGRVAVVNDENEDDIFSPKVKIIYPEDKKEFIDLKERKDTLKIERYLNPWKEGKDFLRLL
jgi:putative nucleotidyltransferase with HDIG domain